MSLGLCCQYLQNGKNIIKARRLQLGRYKRGEYTNEKIHSLYVENLQTLLNGIKIAHADGISVFRMSSNLFPLWEFTKLVFADEEKQVADPEIQLLLTKIGNYVMRHNIRLTTHPDQFVVLSSDRPEVVDSAILQLNFHGWIMDKMGLPRTPYYCINIHGGKRDRTDQLIDGIGRLSEAARSRLTLENCEYGYSVKDLYSVHMATDVPIVFDSHHWKFNHTLSLNDCLRIAILTWPEDIKPLTHLSNSPPDRPGHRSHSDYIVEMPELQRHFNNINIIDVDVEAKAKNLAIMDMVQKLDCVL
jgi:UV DNA damage endonuclease